MLQKIYGKSHLKLGFIDEALDVFKRLIVIDTGDEEVLPLIREIESIHSKEHLQLEQEKSCDDLIEEWVQVDLFASKVQILMAIPKKKIKWRRLS